MLCPWLGRFGQKGFFAPHSPRGKSPQVPVLKNCTVQGWYKTPPSQEKTGDRAYGCPDSILIKGLINPPRCSISASKNHVEGFRYADHTFNLLVSFLKNDNGEVF
jgi:hypothetical protein